MSLSRRELLGGFLAGVSAQELPPKPTEYPKDALNPEILQQIGIKIYPTREVGLIVRQGAFDDPNDIFGYLAGEVKRGRTNLKLNIILVDTDNLLTSFDKF